MLPSIKSVVHGRTMIWWQFSIEYVNQCIHFSWCTEFTRIRDESFPTMDFLIWTVHTLVNSCQHIGSIVFVVAKTSVRSPGEKLIVIVKIMLIGCPCGCGTVVKRYIIGSDYPEHKWSGFENKNTVWEQTMIPAGICQRIDCTCLL